MPAWCGHAAAQNISRLLGSVNLGPDTQDSLLEELLFVSEQLPCQKHNESLAQLMPLLWIELDT